MLRFIVKIILENTSYQAIKVWMCYKCYEFTAEFI